jgi:hypothetical protein
LTNAWRWRQMEAIPLANHLQTSHKTAPNFHYLAWGSTSTYAEIN